jgi:flavin reductase (DIM6/NTAB) family NADH-FMN oxidoreductase RutF
MKISIGKKTVAYVHPVFVIGSYDDKERPNIMTASWGGICCSQPPCVAVSIRKSRYTYQNIMHQKAFTVNIPSIDDVKAADYAGVFSGSEHDKFKHLGLTAVKCETVNAPYISEFPMVLICNLYQTVELGTHTQFIGEIMDVLVDDDKLTNEQMPDMTLIKPIIYDTASHQYFATGELLQKAYTAK